jgi:hypothetical protein
MNGQPGRAMKAFMGQEIGGRLEGRDIMVEE